MTEKTIKIPKSNLKDRMAYEFVAAKVNKVKMSDLDFDGDISIRVDGLNVLLKHTDSKMLNKFVTRLRKLIKEPTGLDKFTK